MRPAFALLALLAALPARADDAPGPAHTFTLAPLSMAFGYWSAEYEQRLAGRWSAYVAPGAALDLREDSSNLSFDGLGLTAGARFFPYGEAPSGLFVALQAQGLFGTTTSLATHRSAGAFGVGLAPLAGYTFILGGWLDISLGLGAEFDLSSLGLSPDEGDPAARFRVQPLPRINAGFAF